MRAVLAVYRGRCLGEQAHNHHRIHAHRVSFLFGETFFQAAYDLARPPQCEGDCVPKDFSLRHASLEHKENKRASRHILCRALQEATSGAPEYYDNDSW